MQTPKCYPTDWTDTQWQRIAPLLPRFKRRRRPKVDRRRVIRALLYRLRSGCSWRMLPREFPHWRTVSGCFRHWTPSGLWATAVPRQPASWTVQSIKTADQSGENGYDAGKHVVGCKSHLLVDTLGVILEVVVRSAAAQIATGPAVCPPGNRQTQRTARAGSRRCPSAGSWSVPSAGC
jgi:putative transposase